MTYGSEQLPPAGIDQLLINGSLLRSQFAVSDLLEFGRQIGSDIFLKPPQQKRAEPSCQPGLHISIFIAKNRQLIALAKILCRTEIARHQKIENGPEVLNRVFQRGSSEHDAVIGANGFYRLRILRLAIFDVLRFIERDGVEFEALIAFGIAADQAVPGYP